MSLTLHPFEPLDLRFFEPSPFAAEARDALGAATARRMARNYATAGPAFTGLWDGEPLFAAGVALFGESGMSGEAWAWLDHARSRALAPSLTLALRRLLDELQAEGLRRVQAHIHADNLPGRRWARLLGFSPEALCRKYLAGSDYMLYARVR